MLKPPPNSPDAKAGGKPGTSASPQPNAKDDPKILRLAEMDPHIL